LEKSLLFVWENLGAIHIDRCRAVSAYFKNQRSIVGIEWSRPNTKLSREPSAGADFRIVTLFPAGYPKSGRRLRLALGLVRSCLSLGRAEIFLSHFENPAIWAVAVVLRLFGRRVFVMSSAKFDDVERFRFREFVKVLALAPYNGALTSGTRAKSYLRFLGMPESRIALGYNTVSIERIRRLSGSAPAPAGVPFNVRHFSIVAPFVAKKNLFLALQAYRQYTDLVGGPRCLHIVGSGPLESELRREVAELGIGEGVTFRGALQIEEICETFATTLALILPSVEERFGNVVIEAQATGLPVLISDVCGAWDQLVQSGVNGFVFEPDNSTGLAYFMSLLSEDEELWNYMCSAARDRSRAGDVDQFVRGVQFLLGSGAQSN
jgi:L-malate glycosyltransferase